MRDTFAGIFASLLVFAAFDAAAAVGPNGLGPNGLGPNGLGPNGLGPNGLGPNGLGPNGLGPNGLGPNGLGPNGLGPNGLGPNGLDVNGLGPNGLGPNGLGPNGVVYLVTPDGTQGESGFRAWFEADPAAASQYMKYFARCAYDSKTASPISTPPGRPGRGRASTASPWRPQDDHLRPSLGTVRGRMTEDEGKWVSACLLAHVNTQGTHQYISLRGNPPNPEAQAALMPTENERWLMAPYGIFFGDLFAPDPAKYAAGVPNSPGFAWAGIVLGRDCDFTNCTFVDASGVTQRILNRNFTGNIWPKIEGAFSMQGTPGPNPWMDTVGTQPSGGQGLWMSTVDTATYHPLFVHGPLLLDLERLETVVDPTRDGQPMSVGSPVDAGQVVTCAPDECSAVGFTDIGQKVVGLTGAQVLETWRSPTGWWNLEPVPDVNEPVTALIRYSSGKAPRTWTTLAGGKPVTYQLQPLAAARVHAPGPDGAMRDFGTEVWPATGSASSYTYLQVYPVHLVPDPLVGRVSARVRISGADRGESCGGVELLRGDGEAGACTNLKSIYFDWKHLKVACREGGQSGAACRGKLILDYRGGKWGWFCSYGGPPVFACTAADAPELDAVGFVPGKPYCMPSDAATFVGVCN